MNNEMNNNVNNLENNGDSAINIDLGNNNTNVNSVDNNVTNINSVVDNSVTSNNINSANINNATSGNQTVSSNSNNNYKNPYANNSNIIVNNPYDNTYNNQTNNSSESVNNNYTENISTNNDIPRKKTNWIVVTIVIIVILVGLIIIFGFVKSVFDNMQVLDKSKLSAWKSSLKLTARNIELDSTLYNSKNGENPHSVDKLCSDPSKLSEVADLGDIKNVTCIPNEASNKYIFKLEGKYQFNGYYGVIECTVVNSSQVSCISKPTKNDFSTTIN